MKNEVARLDFSAIQKTDDRLFSPPNPLAYRANHGNQRFSAGPSSPLAALPLGNVHSDWPTMVFFTMTPSCRSPPRGRTKNAPWSLIYATSSSKFAWFMQAGCRVLDHALMSRDLICLRTKPNRLRRKISAKRNEAAPVNSRKSPAGVRS